MTMTLREQLIGAWKLVSYIETPLDGAPPHAPFGDTPQGLILYTPDGYMSAQLCAGGRAPFASGDWFKGTPQEYEAEATTYIAYSGAFACNEADRTLTHTMFVSLFPNWIGNTQPRIVSIEGNMLYLSTASPIQSGGMWVNSQLAWRRASAELA